MANLSKEVSEGLKTALIVFFAMLLLICACTPRTAVIINDPGTGSPDTLLVRTDRIIRQ